MSKESDFLDLFPHQNNLFWLELSNDLVYDVADSSSYFDIYAIADEVIGEADSCKKSCIADVVRGFVMADEKNRNSYCEAVYSNLGAGKASVRQAINSFLSNQFKENSPDMYGALSGYEFDRDVGNSKISIIKKADDLKSISDHVGSCLTREEDFSFKRSIKDPGTLYLASENERGASYVRALVSSSREKGFALFTDNFESSDGSLASRLDYMFALQDLGQELGVDVYDPGDAVSGSAIAGFEKVKSNLNKAYFKVGYVPEIKVNGGVKFWEDETYTDIRKTL